jgi:uncharacterized glyoxalase superfamily protein PhnB
MCVTPYAQLGFHDARQTDGATQSTKQRLFRSFIVMAELWPGDVMVNDSMMSARSPEAFDGSPAVAAVHVKDHDALLARAVAAGALVLNPIGSMQDTAAP